MMHSKYDPVGMNIVAVLDLPIAILAYSLSKSVQIRHKIKYQVK